MLGPQEFGNPEDLVRWLGSHDAPYFVLMIHAGGADRGCSEA
jgi:hypothetical protein